MIDWLNETSASLFSILSTASLKVLVLVAAAAVVSLFFRNASASLKHLYWMAVLITSALIPLSSTLLPSMTVLPNTSMTWIGGAAKPPLDNGDATAMAAAADRSQEFYTVTQFDDQKTLEHGRNALQVDRRASLLNAPVSPSLNATTVLAAIWLLVAFAFVLVPGLGYTKLLHRFREANAPNALMRAQFQSACAKSQVERRVILMITNDPTMPMTFGVFSPVILLPAQSREWSAERLQMVLLHELAHVKRWDCFWQIVSALTQAMYWFHPTIWFVSKNVSRAREAACDDAVLRAGHADSDYAATLLDVSTGCRRDALAMCAGIAMSRSLRLKRRIASILDTRLNRSLPTKHSWAATMTAMIMIGGSLAAIAPAGQAVATPQNISSAVQSPSRDNDNTNRLDTDALQPIGDTTRRRDNLEASTVAVVANQETTPQPKPELNSRIYMVDAAGRNLQLIADENTISGRNFLGSPAMSHDGKWVVFDATTNRSFTKTRLIKVFLQGADKGKPVDLGPGLGASISADDKSIAFFLHANNPDMLERGAYLMNADGTGRTHLGKGIYPRLSGDDIRYLTVNKFYSPRNLFLGDRTTDKQDRVLKDEIVLGLPTWSPQHDKFAVTVKDGGERVLCLFDADADPRSRVELWRSKWNGEYEETCPDWSPDGHTILFTFWDQSTGQVRIMKVGAEAGLKATAIDIGVSGVSIRDCAWSSDGQRILFAGMGDELLKTASPLTEQH